ncbi:MAG: hypothetical protein LAO79_25880 [Acidobacteriia bacterium]|nr:hypothetical protein [Terriglobia bacterium]
MPIRFSEPPQSAAKHASKLLARGESLTRPHRVYTLTARDLSTGKGLRAAHAGHWRFLIERGGKIAHSVDVSAGGLAHHSRGRRPADAAAAIRRLFHDPASRRARYELRVLTIPALSVKALWLAGKRRSILIPIAPVPRRITAGARYSPQKLLAILRPLAAARLRFDNSPADVPLSAQERPRVLTPAP